VALSPGVRVAEAVVLKDHVALIRPLVEHEQLGRELLVLTLSDGVADAHGFARSSRRIAVFGERYDLTIGLLDGAGTDLEGLAGADRVRAELQDALDELPYDLLALVSITGDERWLD